MLVPGSLVISGCQSRLEVRGKARQLIDAVGRIEEPFVTLIPCLLALLDGKSRQSLLPLFNAGNDAGLTGVRLPPRRTKVAVLGRRLVRQPRLSQEFHDGLTREHPVCREIDESDEAQAERMLGERPSVVQIGGD